MKRVFYLNFENNAVIENKRTYWFLRNVIERFSRWKCVVSKNYTREFCRDLLFVR